MTDKALYSYQSINGCIAFLVFVISMLVQHSRFYYFVVLGSVIFILYLLGFLFYIAIYIWYKLDFII